jgi:hypothetical protein
MPLIQILITKYGPAIAPALLLGYLVVTKQWSQVPAAVTALFAALGISVQVAQAKSAADAAADHAARAASETMATRSKVQRLMESSS